MADSINPMAQHFITINDPRIEKSTYHRLIDIIALAICAVIAGADTWVDIEFFCKSHEEWLKTFFELPGGIPSHDTFGRNPVAK